MNDNYSWETVANAVGVVFNHFQHKAGVEMVDDPVKTIYKNALPKAIMDALALMYAHDYDRWSHTAMIILNGYHQLESKGAIGND